MKKPSTGKKGHISCFTLQVEHMIPRGSEWLRTDMRCGFPDQQLDNNLVVRVIINPFTALAHELQEFFFHYHMWGR